MEPSKDVAHVDETGASGPRADLNLLHLPWRSSCAVAGTRETRETRCSARAERHEPLSIAADGAATRLPPLSAGGAPQHFSQARRNCVKRGRAPFLLDLNLKTGDVRS